MVDSAVVDAFRADHQIGIFIYSEFEPEPVRLWLGVNDVPVGMEAVDPFSGQAYLGGGQLQGVPELEILINGIADRIEIAMSGIDPAQSERWDLEDLQEQVRSAPVYVGVTALDDYYQPVAPIQPLWDGRASFVREVMPPVSGAESPTVSLVLSVGGGVTTRTRISASLWSPPHHRALFPTDAFCDGTARLARGVAPSWPRF